MDAVENILGIALGAGIYWLILWLVQQYQKANIATRLEKYAGEEER
jgi:hypothetical protein